MSINPGVRRVDEGQVREFLEGALGIHLAPLHGQ
jgi:hypothetical protein